MRILAIDPGTKCGWAVSGGIGHIDASGVWDLSTRRHEGGGMRFLRLRTYLREVLDAIRPDAVAYEEVRRHLGTDAAHIYGGIIAIISEECEARNLPYIGMPVPTVKRCATGKGNADKKAMVCAAQAKWPNYGPLKEDQADAMWIAEAAAAQLSNNARVYVVEDAEQAVKIIKEQRQ